MTPFKTELYVGQKFYHVLNVPLIWQIIEITEHDVMFAFDDWRKVLPKLIVEQLIENERWVELDEPL